MNPGAIEEAGQTARSFFDTMRSQPATLALIISNAALLVFIFYALAKAADVRHDLTMQQGEFAKHVTELLAKCVVPGQHNN